MMKSRKIRWTGLVSTHGKRNAYRALVGRSEGKKPLEKPSGRWKDNIKMVLREI
jgi:hypothetical protein